MQFSQVKCDEWRIEVDSVGQVEVPANSLWGAQTQRSLSNFSIGDYEADRMPRSVIKALCLIKIASARVHSNYYKSMSVVVANAIEAAAWESIRDEGGLVVAKEFVSKIDYNNDSKINCFSNFPLRTWQTGSGTQSNMNVNEVLANRATQLLQSNSNFEVGLIKNVNPNDDINRSQSTNDTFSTAMHIAVAIDVCNYLIPGMKALILALEDCQTRFDSIKKIGRTHLQYACPITLGEEFGAFVSIIRHHYSRIVHSLKEDVLAVAQGGTAVGSGINTPSPEWSKLIVNELNTIINSYFASTDTQRITISHYRDNHCNKNVVQQQQNSNVDSKYSAMLLEDEILLSSLQFRPADNLFESISSHNGLLSFHSTLNSLSASLYKISNDIRMLAMGGIGELILPCKEPGSSIMPGKVF